MKVPLKPLSHCLICVPPEIINKTESGFLVPPPEDTRNLAKVVATGSNIRIVKVNDEVIYQGGWDMEYRGQRYIFLEEQDILATKGE